MKHRVLVATSAQGLEADCIDNRTAGAHHFHFGHPAGLGNDELESGRCADAGQGRKDPWPQRRAKGEDRFRRSSWKHGCGAAGGDGVAPGVSDLRELWDSEGALLPRVANNRRVVMRLLMLRSLGTDGCRRFSGDDPTTGRDGLFRHLTLRFSGARRREPAGRPT